MCDHGHKCPIEGFVVCILCGLSMGENIDNGWGGVPYREKSAVSEDQWTQFIRDICNNYPELTGCEVESVECYMLLKRKLREHKMRIRNLDLAAYSIYKSARTVGCGMTPQYICSITACSIKHIAKLGIIFDFNNQTDFAMSYVSSLCYFLDVPGREEMKIARIVQELQGDCFGAKPFTIAAAIIYLFCEKNQLPAAVNNSLTAYAKLCGITPASVRRIIPKLRLFLTQL